MRFGLIQRFGFSQTGSGGGSVAPSNTVAPVISGLTALGSTLSCTTGTWTGSPAVFTYSYQWKRNGVDIGGATSNTYVTVAADSTANITCKVTASNGVLPNGTATSNTLVMANYTPVNSVAPAVTGTAVVGQTLTTTNGTWTNSPVSFTYQWYRGASPIGGATNSTYTLVQADAGNTSNIKCVVTATNGAGSASADSNTVARILDVLANAYIGAEVITSGETDAVNQFYLSIRAQGWTTNIKRMNIYANINSTLQLRHLFGGGNCIAVNSPTFTRAVGSTQTGTSYINSNVNINSIGIARDSNLLYTRTANMTSATVLITGITIGATSLWVARDATNVIAANFAAQAVGPAVSTNKQFSNRRQDSTTQVDSSGATTQSFARTAAGSMMSGNAFDGARNLDGSPGNLMANGTILEAVAYCEGNVDPIVLDGIVSTFISSL